MRSADDIIIISDIHLAVERGKGLFQADEQLASFLTWVREEVSQCLLILNGDVLDFLVGQRPQVDIDADRACEQASDIIERHTEVFDALERLVNTSCCELLFVGGNHDPELIFPTVQQTLERRLAGTCSHPAARWLVNGEAVPIKVGAAKVIIEHGDQYDDWNYIDHEALRRLICLASRNVPYANVYKPPPGSRLVINRLNLLREEYPWIEMLQPLREGVIPLIWELVFDRLPREQQFGLAAGIKELSASTSRSVMNRLLRLLRPQAEYWAEQDLRRQRFVEWHAELGNADTWGRSEKDRAKIIDRLHAVSAVDDFFDTGAPDGSLAAVSRLLEKGADLVVHGHTHSAKAYRVDDGLYLNSGTWGQLMRLPESDAEDSAWAEFLGGLELGKAKMGFALPTFIRVSKVNSGTRAALYRWEDSAPTCVSTWLFKEGRGWRQDKQGSNILALL